MRDDSRPLSGVRIFDLTRYLAGAGGPRILGNLGAEVIRVEWPQHPAVDLTRFLGPFQDEEPGMNRSGFFAQINVDKLSISLNMSSPQGREIARRLIGVSDIVMENFSPDVMSHWDLDYESLKRIKPDIIYISQSGFGQTGPNREFRTYGPIAQAYSGMQLMTGLPDQEPAGWGFSILDHMGAYYGAMAAMMALHYRAKTGEGICIDLAQAQLGCTVTGPCLLDYTVNGRPYGRPGLPPGNRSFHPRAVPHTTYRALGDDEWVVIGAFNDTQWRSLVQGMGDPAWAQEERFSTLLGRIDNEEELDRRIGEWTAQRERYEVMHTLQAAGVPAAVVQTARDKLEADPQLRHRKLYTRLDHLILGERWYEGVPAKLSRTPGQLRRPSPMLGEHDEYVYHEILGLSRQEIEQLRKDGVLTSEVATT